MYPLSPETRRGQGVIDSNRFLASSGECLLKLYKSPVSQRYMGNETLFIADKS